MTTLDDAPLDDVPAEPEPLWGAEVDALLDAADKSPLVRTQRLGEKAEAALNTLAKALRVEKEIAEHADAIARLRRGES